LVTVLKGEVYDVAVDVRVGSPNFGKSAAVVLNDTNRRQFYVPPGFAHGFVVTSEEALFCYKCTEFYNPKVELSVLWNDPDLKIDWPITDPSLSPKDIAGLRLKDIPQDKLPRFT
jgi:dTDP-4-dehydrorhamnose 3,5-epimerase